MCIRDRAQSLAGDAGMADLPRIYQDVLLQRTSVQAAAGALDDPMQRQLAYEMAVCVCDVDGRQTAAERDFLATLKTALQLDAQQTAAFDQEADALVDVAEKAIPPTLPAVAAPGTAPAAPATGTSDADLDKSILNYALLNGALELLPQSWASMAIIPLQIRMVYGVGMAMSFATTYALGQLARRYYAGGRVMTTALLRETYQGLLEPAQQMQTRFLPQIRQKAGTLDAAQVMAIVRGG